MRPLKRVMVCLAATIMAWSVGCTPITQPAKEIRQYTLEYSTPDFGNLKKLPFSIRVEFFRASPDYAGRQMVYRSSDFSREAYIYHRWRSSPARMLEYLLMRDLRDSRLFDLVTGSGQHMVTTHVLSGMVDEFLELDERDGRAAFLSVSLTLRRVGGIEVGKGLFFQKNYESRVPLSGGGPGPLARAMSQAAARFSKKAIADIHAALAKEKKQS